MTPFTTTTHEAATIARAGIGSTVAIVRRLKEPYGLMEWSQQGWKPISTPLSPGKPVWVREKWENIVGGEVTYFATAREDTGWTLDEIHEMRWFYAKAMPRWASRFTLTPETVRVCRVQDVGHDEAMKAGGEFIDGWHPAIGLSRKLFGPAAWEQNDWVMVALCKIGGVE